jgi:hypothetical protein
MPRRKIVSDSDTSLIAPTFTEVEAKPVVKNTLVPTMRIKNNLRQMVPLNIRNSAGIEVGIEIPAYSEIIWPKVPDPGPDLRIKTCKKYLTVLK